MEVQANEVKAAKWFLVTFLGGARKKTSFRYVARAKTDMDNDDGETTMLGYRSVDGWKTLTKIADGDVFTVPFTDLVCALTAPVDEVCGPGRKTHIRFIARGQHEGGVVF